MQYNLALPLLILAIESLALPNDQQKASLSPNTVRVRYNDRFQLHLPSTLLRACLKYNVSVPRDVEHAAAASQRRLRRDQQLEGCDFGQKQQRKHANIAAIPHYYDAEYLCDVEIGTPAQHFNLNFDTGSSDLWVYGTEMPAEQMHGQVEYNPNSSSSASRMEGEHWLAEYIDGGYVSGDVFLDTVMVGGLAVEAQGVQVADLAHHEITDKPAMDGILGLGFDELNFARPTRLRTWFSNVAKGLQEPVFTVDFRQQDVGRYTFGYIDTSRLAGTVVYTPVDTREGYWTWTSTGYAMGSGENRTPFRSHKLTGTVDTATPVMVLPEYVVREYYSRVDGARYDRGQGGWVFACDVTLPDFAFGVGGDGAGNGESDSGEGQHVITIPGSYLDTGPVEDDGMAVDGTSTGGQICGGGIQSLGGHVVFGAVALKAGIAVFDARKDGERLGWANKTLTL